MYFYLIRYCSICYSKQIDCKNQCWASRNFRLWIIAIFHFGRDRVPKYRQHFIFIFPCCCIKNDGRLPSHPSPFNLNLNYEKFILHCCKDRCFVWNMQVFFLLFCRTFANKMNSDLLSEALFTYFSFQSLCCLISAIRCSTASSSGMFFSMHSFFLYRLILPLPAPT